MDALAALDRRLSALAARGRFRRLSPRAGVDFASNDYLGLAGDPQVAAAVVEALARGVRLGSGGSRLLRGNAPEHEALEEQAAAFFGAERALFFANGFAANLSLLSALPATGDLVVLDALAHASMHDGLKHCRADHRFVAHNDAGAVDDAIGQWRRDGGRGGVWIVFETIYSMDGDLAPVAALAAVAERHDAVLVADEAHATGVLGPGGRGLARHGDIRTPLISLHTCGKALGVEGALVCAPAPVIEHLINRARPFIYSTAPSPIMAVAVGAALERSAGADEERAQLAGLVERAGLSICGPLGIAAPQSQIVPVVLGDDRRTMAVAEALVADGFDVRGVRPPTVPRGASRLRLSLTLNARPQDVDGLGRRLAELIP